MSHRPTGSDDDVLRLARGHLGRFWQLASTRTAESRGPSWDVALETARLLGVAVSELESARDELAQERRWRPEAGGEED